MEVYKRETEEILKRFTENRIGYQECVAALYAALAGVVQRITPEELPQVRGVMLENNQRLIAERARRAGAQKAN